MKLNKIFSIPVFAAICVASVSIWLCRELEGEKLENDPLTQGEVSAHIPDHREVQWPHDIREPVKIKPVSVHVHQNQASQVVQLLHEGTIATIDVQEWTKQAVVDFHLDDFVESSTKLNLTQLIYLDYTRKNIPQVTAAKFSKRLRHNWAKIPHSYFAYTPDRHNSNLIKPCCSYHKHNDSWAMALFTGVEMGVIKNMFRHISFQPYPFAGSSFRNPYPSALFWGASVGSLHYDYQDNALIQLRGTKQVIVYPPNLTKAILHGSSGDEDRLSPTWYTKSDFLRPATILKRPELEMAAQQVILEPGMGLLIPAGALHAPRALTYDSMSVNSYLIGGAGPNQYIEALDAPGYKEFKKEFKL